MQTAVSNTPEMMNAAATIKIIMKRLIIESETDLFNPDDPEFLAAFAPLGEVSSTKMVIVVCVCWGRELMSLAIM